MSTSLAAIWSVGPWEILLVLLILVLVFGARKLPELGRGLGEGLRNLRKGLRDASEDGPSGKSSPDGQDERPRS